MRLEWRSHLYTNWLIFDPTGGQKKLNKSKTLQQSMDLKLSKIFRAGLASICFSTSPVKWNRASPSCSLSLRTSRSLERFVFLHFWIFGIFVFSYFRIFWPRDPWRGGSSIRAQEVERVESFVEVERVESFIEVERVESIVSSGQQDDDRDIEQRHRKAWRSDHQSLVPSQCSQHWEGGGCSLDCSAFRIFCTQWFPTQVKEQLAEFLPVSFSISSNLKLGLERKKETHKAHRVNCSNVAAWSVLEAPDVHCWVTTTH